MALSISTRLLILALPVAGLFQEQKYPDHSFLHTRDPVSRLAIQMEPFWQKLLKNATEEANSQRRLLLSEFKVAADPVRERPEIDPEDEAKEAAMRTSLSYGKLPRLNIDRGSGATYPRPVSAPYRTSAFRGLLSAGSSLNGLASLRKKIRHWSTQPLETREQAFREILRRFDQVEMDITLAAHVLRISQEWIPLHLTALQESSKDLSKRPRAYQAVDAVLGRRESGADLSLIREWMRPRRVSFLPFLPRKFNAFRNQTIVIPGTTDVDDANFLAEFDGAIDTHWNQSPWARKLKIQFLIRWKHIPKNSELAAGRQGFDEHLRHFPADRLALTTGGATTYVRGHLIVIGPSPITPRVLAHEFGHILGFPDCYMRTLAGQGFFGITVQEWDNPFFPDELMCDSLAGVAHALMAE